MSDDTGSEPILVERRDPIALVRLNRPEALNALSDGLLARLGAELQTLDRDPAVRVIVLAGNGRAFAAGADINELAVATSSAWVLEDPFRRWEAIRRIQTPIVAAVHGFALGGGCELALTCDLVIASRDARFGQPEINIGLIPGAGGTQRLTRATGKAVAMDVCLTGRFLTAEEALACGIVSRIVDGDVVEEALAVAAKIAQRSPVAVRLAKRAVLAAFETSLEAGLEVERIAFLAALASEDAKEGTLAFLEKRTPQFEGR
jgi:enoyl-CoA hydratase/carnithine racemase